MTGTISAREVTNPKGNRVIRKKVARSLVLIFIFLITCLVTTKLEFFQLFTKKF